MPALHRQRCQCNKSHDASATRATMPAQWWQRCQRDNGNDASATKATTPVLGWQRGPCNKDDDTSATMANTLAQQGQWHQHKEDKDASMMRATTPDQHGQWFQPNAGRGMGATRMTMPVQRSHNCIFCFHYCWHHAAVKEAILSHPSASSNIVPYPSKVCYMHHHHGDPKATLTNLPTRLQPGGSPSLSWVDGGVEAAQLRA